MIRPAFRWALLAVACLWFLTTAAQAAPVPEWVGIALTVTLTGLVPVGWYGVSLYRGHAAELEALRLRVSLLEQLVEQVVEQRGGPPPHARGGET